MAKALNIDKLKANGTILRQLKTSASSGNFQPDASFIANNAIKLDLTYILNPANGEPFISRTELNELAPLIIEKFHLLQQERGDCRDDDIPMLGWLSLPDKISRQHLDDIMSSVKELSGKIDAYVSLGIGGSYLGIEATFKALTHAFFNQLPREKRGTPEIYFLGQNTDPDFLRDTLDMLDGKRVGVNVISKSGTTAETAIAFRIIRDILEREMGESSREFVFATTDAVKGALKEISDQKGYRQFVVPDNIGGRFSVLSDVGLVGLAMAGIDIYEFVAGFRQMKKRVSTDDFWANLSMLHAAVRYLAHRKGKKIEIVASNSAALYQLGRWMEQLFPESEGHNGFGLWVSPSLYSEKLHANGQMIQQGERNMIETFLKLENSDNPFDIPLDKDNLDGLNYLSENKRDINFINNKVIEGPAYAHFMGDVPNMTIEIPRRNAFNIGQFYYMMELSVALSGYLAGHNPFIQPGVEAYKKALFAMLGKPGTDSDSKSMDTARERLNRIII